MGRKTWTVRIVGGTTLVVFGLMVFGALQRLDAIPTALKTAAGLMEGGSAFLNALPLWASLPFLASITILCALWLFGWPRIKRVARCVFSREARIAELRIETEAINAELGKVAEEKWLRALHNRLVAIHQMRVIDAVREGLAPPNLPPLPDASSPDHPDPGFGTLQSMRAEALNLRPTYLQLDDEGIPGTESAIEAARATHQQERSPTFQQVQIDYGTYNEAVRTAILDRLLLSEHLLVLKKDLDEGTYIDVTTVPKRVFIDGTGALTDSLSMPPQ